MASRQSEPGQATKPAMIPAVRPHTASPAEPISSSGYQQPASENVATVCDN